jgi:ABC-type spermidine/putrescine transport system permease subunit I
VPVSSCRSAHSPHPGWWGPTTDIITVLIYEQTLSLLNWPFGAAAAWVLLLLVLTLIWAQGVLLRRYATRLSGA